MRVSGKQTKRAVALTLCLALLLSMLAFALTVRAEEVEDLADTSADTYYLWGEATNSPNFNGTTPSGTFTYDSSKGYYYCDVSGASGDYCFVISTNGTTVSGGQKYYVQAGNYHGYNCLHLWNPSGDALRMYFTSPSIGLVVIAQTDTNPTQAPTQMPTQAPTTPQPTSGGGTTPTTPQPTQSGGSTDKRYVYCKNEAGWSSVYAYLWNSNSDNNHEWPGVKMTNIGGDVWRYEVPKTFAKIIFNIGSNQTQTGDMTYPGDGYIYNNKTGAWEIYDTSPLQVSVFATDLDSPQYNGVGITLSAQAEGQGTVYYKFSVTNSSGSTAVLHDFSTAGSVLWTPLTPGTYTLTYHFKDDAGNTNQRTKSYTIEDGSSVVAPYIKTVTPNGGDIQNNKTVNMSVSAGGGVTGTNLLFYKYTVTDPLNNTANVPYYTRSTSYSFKPTSLGLYTVKVSVQGSDNKTIERSYILNSVGSVSPTEPPVNPPTEPAVPETQAATQAPTQKPTQAPTQAPTEPEGVILGDADDDGDVTVIDVTFIQRYEAGISLPSPLNTRNADVDGDEDVTIIDATLVQRFMVGLIKKFPAEQ